ncbi:hypothetical protein MCAMS1_01188 [biofilm metagenome]
MSPRICKSLLFLALFCLSPAFGDGVRLLVVFPLTDSPNDEIYNLTVEAIAKHSPSAERLALPDGVDTIHPQLNPAQYSSIIALGNSAIAAVNTTAYKTKMLAGLSYFGRAEYNGVSLALDSNMLIPQLHRLVPQIKRVFVIHEPDLQVIDPPNKELPPLPRLIIKKGNDPIAVIKLVGDLLEHEATSSDAVFIPPNLPENILYEVVKVAWDKGVMLLSTNLGHLESGATMVFFPDNAGIGEQLALMALAKTPGYENVKKINVGLNRKIAQHLGLEFSPNTIDLFAVKIK